MSSMPPPFISSVLNSKWTWGVMALLVLFLAVQLSSILFPFVCGVLLAYVLYPVQRKILSLCEKCPALRWVSPSIVAVFLIVLSGVLLMGVGALLVPMLWSEIPQIVERIPLLIKSTLEALAPFAQKWGIALPSEAQLGGQIKASVHAYSDVLMQSLLKGVLIGGSSIATVAGNALLIPIVLYYALLEWERMVERAHLATPISWRPYLERLAKKVDELIGGYFHGQVLLMGLLSVYYCVALWALGLPWAASIGVFTGLAIAIPYVGFALGLLLSVIMSVVHWEGWFLFLGVLAVYGVGQVAESLYLTPKLVGEKIGLHPVLVIFLLLAFGKLMGFMGMLLALPLGAIVMVIVQELFEQYKKSELFKS